MMASAVPCRASSTMAAPKILVIPGSLHAKSHNVRLAALVTKELTLADADVTRISLADYPLPIYDADAAEESGPPHNAVTLKRLMSVHRSEEHTSELQSLRQSRMPSS